MTSEERRNPFDELLKQMTMIMQYLEESGINKHIREMQQSGILDDVIKNVDKVKISESELEQLRKMNEELRKLSDLADELNGILVKL